MKHFDYIILLLGFACGFLFVGFAKQAEEIKTLKAKIEELQHAKL